MSLSVSPAGLFRLNAETQTWRAESLSLPWGHPQLRPALLKTGLLVGVSLLLLGLEWQGSLNGGPTGLFPALLGVGVLLQLWGLQTLRMRVLRLEADRQGLRIWESRHPEAAPHLLRWGDVEQLAVGTQATGRRRQQPVLQVSGRQSLEVGGGLPADELNWLLAELNQWRNHFA